MSRPEPTIARGARAPGTCRLCAQPLSALARRRGDVCDAMDCRRRSADAVAAQRRESDLDAMRSAAARAWDAPELPAAPVFWLRHHGEDVAPPPASDIEELRAWLMALADDEPASPPADGALAGDAPSSPLGGQLCALCRGRCCRFGRTGHAFIEPHQLQRWLAQRSGATWADAVEHWLAFVPDTHLESSCLFHGERGCTLPRERRSNVCNQYACDVLERVRELGESAPVTVLLVGVVASHRLHAAATVSAQGLRPLPDSRAAD